MPDIHSSNQTSDLWVDQGGAGDTTYLLLHGGSCNGDVWCRLREIIDNNQAGKWIIPDIRGHGRSPWADFYSIGGFAAALAPLVGATKRLIIIGHSMGGSIGLAMASGWFKVRVSGVMTIGTLADWSDEVLAKGENYMAKPVRVFETREEAQRHYMLVSGLIGLVDIDSPELANGVVAKNGGFCLAADTNILQSSGLSIGELIKPIKCPVRLTCGANDKLVSVQQLRNFDDGALEIPNAAHNAHVENPTAIWQAIKDFEREL